jgi:abhydrolase domain-containing protein 6
MLLRRLKFLAVFVALLVVLLGGSYLFAPQWLLRGDYARLAMAAHLEKHTVQAGDTTWSYYEGGEGPTLVLLHGFAADKTVWLPVARELGANFHLVIPDLPGWGESSRVSGAGYDVEAQAARLQAFAEALRLPRFVLVGHSLGGAIAGVYAAEHPERVAELALIDSYGLRADASPLDREVLAGKHPFVFDDRAGFRRALSEVFVQPPRVPGRIADVFVARNRADRSFIERTLGKLRQPSQSLALQERLDRLSMPVLGLWCASDRVVDVSALDSLRNGLTRAPAISSSVLNGCNHVPMLEKPQDTARILAGFALSH